MRVLLCHNYYQQRGGEDVSFEQEAELLAAGGLEVHRSTWHNDEVAALGRAELALKTLWNARVYRELRQQIQRLRPDIVHFTNTFPLVSPAAHYAARREKVPVVQALRNYRLGCANAQLLRDGNVCELCLGRRVPWPAVWHGCYRGSRAASAVVVASTLLHRGLGTWQRKVDLFYTLTEFARGKLIEAGVPAPRIEVKPNFVPRAETAPGSRQGAVFVGRLSAEKGTDTLLAAWKLLPADVPLTIVGDGPCAASVRQAVEADCRVRWLGERGPEQVRQILARAGLLLMPSIWYETFGRTIIEAYSVGTPVLASRRGAMAELVQDGVTGRLFAPGDPHDLVRTLLEMLADAPHLESLGRGALAQYEARYTPERNYQQLLALYQRARALYASSHRGQTRSPAAAFPSPSRHEV